VEFIRKVVLAQKSAPRPRPATRRSARQNKVAALGRTVEGTTSCRVIRMRPLLFLSGFEIAAPEALVGCLPAVYTADHVKSGARNASACPGWANSC